MDWILVVVPAAVAVVAVYLVLHRRRLPTIPDTADDLLASFARADAGSGALFGDPPGTPFPGPGARRWALGVLFEAGVDADADPRYAARLLVRAEPRLGLEHANALVRALL